MFTIITIPNAQLKEIEVLCQEQHISRSELICLALNFYIEVHKVNQGNKEKAFGILKNSGIDAIEHQNKLRSEWN